MQTWSRIIRLLAKQLSISPDRIAPDDTMETLTARHVGPPDQFSKFGGSLLAKEQCLFLVNVEDEFGVRLTDQDQDALSDPSWTILEIVDYLDRKIRITDYNPQWPVAFAELKAVFERALGDVALAVEHVGSTSVPGLAAKPILDIDIVIDSGERLPDAVRLLEQLGYTHQGDLGIPGREAFAAAQSNAPRDGSGRVWPPHHLYVCARDCAELARHLAFRDYLRAHPEEAQAYGELKREWAVQFGGNRDAYSRAKTPFIEKALRNM